MSSVLLLLLSLLPFVLLLGVAAIPVAQTAPQLTSKPLSWLKPDPKQPRKHFDQAELRLLGTSLKVRQLQPVLARPDGTIIDGERRWRAAQMAGMETLNVIVTEESLSETQVRLIQLTANMQRSDLSGWEKYQACAEILAANPTWQMKDLADHLHLDPSGVTRILSPSKCIPAWVEALKAGKVSISDCYCASKLPEPDQDGLLALKLSGVSRDVLEQAGKKKRKAADAKPEVKLSRFKGQVPGKSAIVQVTGAEFGLSDLIEILTELTKLARAADTDNQDLSAFQGVLKAKVKAKPKGKEKPGAT